MAKMRRIKLTKEEQEIEDAINNNEFVPADEETQKRIASYIEAYKKNSVLHMRINSQDLKNLKLKAKKLGVKYQTFIAEILHRVAQS